MFYVFTTNAYLYTPNSCYVFYSCYSYSSYVVVLHSRLRELEVKQHLSLMMRRWEVNISNVSETLDMKSIRNVIARQGDSNSMLKMDVVWKFPYTLHRDSFGKHLEYLQDFFFLILILFIFYFPLNNYKCMWVWHEGMDDIDFKSDWFQNRQSFHFQWGFLLKIENKKINK
jgi:hypothetical protein